MTERPTVDWIEKLAARESEAYSKTTKEERIAKRASKKRQRETLKKHTTAIGAICTQSKASASKNESSYSKRFSVNVERIVLKERLNSLATSIEVLLESLPTVGTSFHSYKANGTTFKKRKWDEVSLQPRKRDYGGIGLARPSIFIAFEDPSFVPKLEEEFAEHVPGFFGKQKTKVMKKNQNRNMLWKRIADIKHSGARLNGKKMSDMTPNERVEALIKAGMI